MASSENQGLQITLIVFVFLTLILGVTTFWFVRQWSEVRDRQQKDAQDNVTKTSALNKAVSEIDRLKDMIGLPKDASGAAAGSGLGATEEQFKKDMQLFAATYPEDKQRYRDALSTQAAEIADLSKRLKDEQARVQDLNEKHLAREAAKDEQINRHLTELQTAKNDLAEERAKFKTELDRITADNEALKSRLAQMQSDLDTRTAEFENARKQLQTELTTLQARLTDLDQKYKEETRQTFEVADGEIVKVNLATKTVWINLGSDDHLRPQVTFSVYGSQANDVARYDKKGSIEVTQILGGKLAEARILDDQLLDPLSEGDKIYTPAWHPGRQERFALVGMLDLDGDKLSDRETIRNLISMAGGAIDAELNDKGERTGQMTINTRYLVAGEEPSGEEFKRYAEMLKEARTLGIEVLTLSKFLDHVGFKDPKRLLHFSTGKGEDFSRDRPDGGYPVSRANLSGVFRKRTPPPVRNRSEAETD